MTMPPYPVLCYAPGCGRPAHFKIAARWSDGVTRELKTYYLACPGCLARLFAEARRKQPLCRLAVGESLEPPAVYELRSGARDQDLVRREDLERTS
jgi:hypothetical protein